jgi:hypothetical protein
VEPTSGWLFLAAIFFLYFAFIKIFTVHHMHPECIRSESRTIRREGGDQPRCIRSLS